MSRAVGQYDTACLKSGPEPFGERQTDLVYCSDLRRSTESAAAFFPSAIILPCPLYREAEVPVPLPGWIKLSFTQWLVVARFVWFLRNFARRRKRIQRACASDRCRGATGRPGKRRRNRRPCGSRSVQLSHWQEIEKIKLEKSSRQWMCLRVVAAIRNANDYRSIEALKLQQYLTTPVALNNPTILKNCFPTDVCNWIRSTQQDYLQRSDP